MVREVTLHVLPEAGTPSVERVAVTPLATDGKPSGDVDVSVVLRSATAGKDVTLALCWDTQPLRKFHIIESRLFARFPPNRGHFGVISLKTAASIVLQ